MSVKNKLVLLASTLLVGLLLASSLAFYGTHNWAKDMSNIGENRLVGVLALSNLNRERMVIRAQTLNVYEYEYNYNSKEEFLNIASQRAKSWEIIDENWDTFAKLPRGSQKGKEAFEKLEDEYKQWRNIYVTLDSIIAKLSQNSDEITQQKLISDYKKSYCHYDTNIKCYG